MNSTRRVLLAGASGLVGRAALASLLADPEVVELRVLTRRTLDGLQRDPRVQTCLLNDFTHLATHAEWFAVDQVLCALGTTMRQAGSAAAFRRVDYEYPLAIAKLALDAGATHYALVSAAGASAHSSVFYNRVKGALEESLRAQGWRSLSIARPSLLLGVRAQLRVAENVAKRIGWLAPPAYRPVEASKVARALVRCLHENVAGARVLDNRVLRAEP